MGWLSEEFTGARWEFLQRLGESWSDLADCLGIPERDRRRFPRGEEARCVWAWSAERERLSDLRAALLVIGRPDLFALLDGVDLSPPGPPRPWFRAGARHPTARRRGLPGLLAVVVLAGTVLFATTASGGDERPPGQPYVADGADPNDSGCGAEAVTVDKRQLYIDQIPVGLVELRYSPRCGVSWGRVSAPPLPAHVSRPGPIRLHIDVVRRDGRSLPFEDEFAGQGGFGDVLHSTVHCVHASAYFLGPGWAMPPTATGCYRGTTALTR